MIDYLGLFWFLVFLIPLLVLQRQLHKEIQAILLLLTRRADVSIVLFSLIFFPGVAMHELSHWLMAKLLGVPTGRFSLIPRPMANGRLRLGLVETAPTNLLGEALIGTAPLLAGGAFVAYAGWLHLGVSQIYPYSIPLNWATWEAVISLAIAQPDFWLWVYLTFVISSTMFPSSSDRRAWLPLLLIAALTVGLVFLAGAAPWFIQNFAPVLDAALQSITFILAISLGLHLIFFLPAFLVRQGLSRITHMRVV